MRIADTTGRIFATRKDYNSAVKELDRQRILTPGPGLEVHDGPGGRHIGFAGGVLDNSFIAAITAYSAAGGKYTYSWAEQEYATTGYDGWATLSGGRTGTNAYNWAEVVDHLWQYQPVPVGTIVRLKQYGSEYWFNGDMDPEWQQAPSGTKALDSTPATLAAETDTWAPATDDGYGFSLVVMTGMPYDVGNGKFFAKVRTVTVDAGGRIYAASAETALEIVALVDCT